MGNGSSCRHFLHPPWVSGGGCLHRWRGWGTALQAQLHENHILRPRAHWIWFYFWKLCNARPALQLDGRPAGITWDFNRTHTHTHTPSADREGWSGSPVTSARLSVPHPWAPKLAGRKLLSRFLQPSSGGQPVLFPGRRLTSLWCCLLSGGAVARPRSEAQRGEEVRVHGMWLQVHTTGTCAEEPARAF